MSQIRRGVPDRAGPVRAGGAPFGPRKPSGPREPECPAPPEHWTGPTWDDERGRWRPSHADALADWVAGRGAYEDDLPRLDETCTVRHEGSGNACGHPLVSNGMCVAQGEHAHGVRPRTDPRGPISLDEQLAAAGNPAAQWRLDHPEPVQAEASVPDPVVAWKAEQDRESAQRADAVERAIDDTVAASVADGGDVDANERDRRLVDAGIRFEQARMQAAAAGSDQKKHKAAQDGAFRELLDGFVDSGQASLSLIMPDSGENRVLTPYSKIWPKVRPIVDPASGNPVLDEKDRPVLASTDARIAAIRKAGLADELLDVKINSTALNEMFEGFASDDDVPEALREVYELSTEWKMSSVKGGHGRSRTPTSAEVANGRRAGSGE